MPERHGENPIAFPSFNDTLVAAEQLMGRHADHLNGGRKHHPKPSRQETENALLDLCAACQHNKQIPHDRIGQVQWIVEAALNNLRGDTTEELREKLSTLSQILRGRENISGLGLE